MQVVWVVVTGQVYDGASRAQAHDPDTGIAMSSLQRQRVLDCLRESDPDELVDILGVSSWELMAAFPDRVQDYIERESYEQDDEEDDIL